MPRGMLLGLIRLYFCYAIFVLLLGGCSVRAHTKEEWPTPEDARYCTELCLDINEHHPPLTWQECQKQCIENSIDVYECPFFWREI